MNIEPEDDPTHEPEYLFDGEQPVLPEHDPLAADTEIRIDCPDQQSLPGDRTG